MNHFLSLLRTVDVLLPTLLTLQLLESLPAEVLKQRGDLEAAGQQARAAHSALETSLDQQMTAYRSDLDLRVQASNNAVDERLAALRHAVDALGGSMAHKLAGAQRYRVHCRLLAHCPRDGNDTLCL